MIDVPTFTIPDLPEGVTLHFRAPRYVGVVQFWLQSGSATISIYFDTADVFGSMGEPYFEILHPDGQECSRFTLPEADRMWRKAFALLDPFRPLYELASIPCGETVLAKMDGGWTRRVKAADLFYEFELNKCEALAFRQLTDEENAQ